MVRGFVADFFGDVSNGQVDRISALVSEECELSLVGRNDEGYNSRSRLITFKLVLSSG